MKRLIFLLIMLISFNVHAKKIDFGTFDYWESYFLTYDYGGGDRGALCAVKGNFLKNGEKAKVIYAIYNDGSYKFLLETRDSYWKLEPGHWVMVRAIVKDINGNVTYNGIIRATNNSRHTIKQLPFIVDESFFLTSFAGSSLHIYFVDVNGNMNGQGYIFDINSVGMLQAFKAAAENCPF